MLFFFFFKFHFFYIFLCWKTESHACHDGWTKCDNGIQCFDLNWRCDGVIHCTDGSDELACTGESKESIAKTGNDQTYHLSAKEKGIGSWGRARRVFFLFLFCFVWFCFVLFCFVFFCHWRRRDLLYVRSSIGVCFDHISIIFLTEKKGEGQACFYLRVGKGGDPVGKGDDASPRGFFSSNLPPFVLFTEPHFSIFGSFIFPHLTTDLHSWE